VSLSARRLRLGTVSVTLLLAACSGDPDPHAAPERRAFQVATAVVAPRDIPLLYTTTGTVVSDERVEIASRMTAYVRTLEVREGERVRRGQRLATLESRDVEAGVIMARAERDKAAAADRDAQRDLEDSEKLLARGMVAHAHQRKAMLQRQSARESLQAAEAALVRAESERQYTRIDSPVAGIVVARHQRVGDLASPGTPLVTVESDTALLFETHAVERRVTRIRIGDPVGLMIDALDAPLEGQIVRLVSSGDPVTRGFQVKVSVPDTPGLLPGMFGRAQFTVGSRKAVVVPTTALVDRGGLTGVYVVDADGAARFRWLRTEHGADGGRVVLAGLDGGERIVVAPDSKMREGDRIVAQDPAGS
jgi:RND family efflux transporter MFP subunit